MSKLIYITNTSLDDYMEDETRVFDWVHPDQVFVFIAELLQPIGNTPFAHADDCKLIAVDPDEPAFAATRQCRRSRR